MKRMVLVLLTFVPALHAKSPDYYASPTEFIMQFLKKSGTLWVGSIEWKDSLNSMEINNQIHTNFATTHLQEYRGFAARFIKLSEAGVKSSFIITKKEGCMEVDSHIQYIEQKAVSEEELQWYRKKNRYPDEKKKVEEDLCTRCEYIETMKLDEKARILSIILTAQCKSRIINHRFAKELAQ